jgi:hypothetical protein
MRSGRKPPSESQAARRSRDGSPARSRRHLAKRAGLSRLRAPMLRYVEQLRRILVATMADAWLHATDLHRIPLTVAPWRKNAPFVERRSHAVQARYPGRPQLFHEGGEPRWSLGGSRLADFVGGAARGRCKIIARPSSLSDWG